MTHLEHVLNQLNKLPRKALAEIREAGKREDERTEGHHKPVVRLCKTRKDNG